MFHIAILSIFTLMSGCTAENATSMDKNTSNSPPKKSGAIRYIEDLRKYLQIKSDEDDLEAMTLLGESYFFAPKKLQDRTQSGQWLQRAADKGHPRALYNVGWSYYTGRGVNQDKDRARKLWQQSCEKGFVPACDRIKTPSGKRKKERSES